MSRSLRVWLLLGLASIALVGAVDAVLLQLGKDYFTNGYNGHFLAGAGPVLGFFAAGGLLDGFVLLAAWALCVPLLARAGLSGLRLAVAAGLAGLAIPLGMDLVQYRIHRVLGDVIGLGVLWELAGASVSGSIAEAMSQSGPVGLVAVGALAGGALAIGIAGRVERRWLRGLPFERPPGRDLLCAALACGIAGSATLVVTESRAVDVHHGLVRKPSGLLLTGLTSRLTDVDGDGFGLLSRPRDPAPFDASVHPWALDLPGDGIDENGLAGDLPADVRALAPVPLPAPGDTGPARPPFLLVFLETFRADLLDARQDGRPVTPFLSRIAHEGAHSDLAYVHTPSTAPSREQLLSGSLSFEPGDGTLLDDFRERGYELAWFSGQDDTHGQAESRLGLRGLDHFRDARDDVALRTSRSTAAVSLQISWKLLLRRVEEYLDARSDPRPLFLYVNLVDTHFPYDHEELDDLLGVGHLDRSDITPENAQRVVESYRNAAANVDEALEALFDIWRAHVGDDFAALVTADHGQSFYENGVLGHGQSLGELQSRVPLVLHGIGGTWPEPLGLADVRGLLLRHAFAPRGARPPRARFEARADREIFQYLADLEAPWLIGVRDRDGLVSTNLRTGDVRAEDAAGAARPLAGEARRRAFRRVVHHWEAIRVAREAADG